MKPQFSALAETDAHGLADGVDGWLRRAGRPARSSVAPVLA
ncbi:hypothetical protein VZC37_20395 [Gordonia sp. LSe1-13]|uniref:Uncharacterized protein n=1 Tax=Gordonia sesuvii TaxID=3116777 RepID=A0ABU7MJF9_9ACTN|nr:hypothetical protein [Gordonia sp. LSe1-13]